MKKGKQVLGYLIVFALLLGGCSASSPKNEYAGDSYAEAAVPAEAENGFYEVGEAAADSALEADGGLEQQSSGITAQQERKLIRDVDMSVETTEFDAFVAMVADRTAAYGGYIEQSNLYNGSYTSDYRSRSADITARIPSGRLDEFVDGVSAKANVTSKSENVRDVTLEYVDLESHKKALLAEQESLISMLEQSGTIEEIIAINQQLTDVRYQIESMESQLRTYDNQIDYSTVRISVSETVYYEPYEEKGAWDRITEGFLENMDRVGRFFKNFGIEFVIALPILVPAGLIITAVIVLLRRLILRSEKSRKEKKKIHDAEQTEKSGLCRPCGTSERRKIHADEPSDRAEDRDHIQ